MMATISSGHGDQEDNRFRFELLPRVIKEMILERVIDETADFDDFKKFWRLRLVNKEFNSILSSNYADRHFPKYPCAVFFRKHNIENRVLMHLVLSDSIELIRTNYRAYAFEDHSFFTRFLTLTRIENIEMKWEDVPKYFKDKPFRLSFLDIDARWVLDPHVSNPHMIQAIRELDNQTPGKLDVGFIPELPWLTWYNG